MTKKQKQTSFVNFMKQVGLVVAPIVAVAAIFNYTFDNSLYTKIAIGVTIIILYFIRLELKIRRLEKNARFY